MTQARFRTDKIVLFLSFTIFGTTFVAGLESAQTLPKGINRSRYIRADVPSINDRYNSKGTRESLSQYRFFTGNDLASEMKKQSLDPTNPDQALMAGFTALHGLLENLQPGLGNAMVGVEIEVPTEVRASRQYFTLEHGLTDKVVIGVGVPVESIEVNAKAFAKTHTQTETIKKKLRAIGKGAEINEKLDMLEKEKAIVSKKVLDEAFVKKGYKIPSNFSKWAMGEIEVGGSYQFIKNDDQALRIETRLRLPTSTHEKDFHNPVDPGIGDDQVDIYSKILHDWHPYKSLTINSVVKYTYQFADTKRMPVPGFGELGLPDLNDPDTWDDVDSKLGNFLELEFGAYQRFFNNTLELTAIYQFLAKEKDRFKGRKNRNFSVLGKDSAKTDHRLEIGAKLGTVQMVLDKKFFLPIEARIAYNFSLGGQNTEAASFTRFDFHLFF